MRYYSTIGMSAEQFAELSQQVSRRLWETGLVEQYFSLSFDRQLEVMLLVLRQNLSQMVAAEMFAVSQSTISRIVRRLGAVVSEVLGDVDQTVYEVGGGRVVLIDGTFVPTGNRPGHGRELERANYSGKHRVQCLNIQVASRTDGSLIAVSDPVPGARHDCAALQLTGWDQQVESITWIADTAYTGTGAITPRKRPRGKPRPAADKIFNKSIASIRAVVEHAIRHLKEWKVLATGYRGRLRDLPPTIRTVYRLEMFRQASALDE